MDAEAFLDGVQFGLTAGNDPKGVARLPGQGHAAARGGFVGQGDLGQRLGDADPDDGFGRALGGHLLLLGTGCEEGSNGRK